MKDYRHKLALGTAQWGMHYGITNKTGKTSVAAINQIIKISRDHGVTLIDTAPAYGDAESLIGKCNKDLDIVTKIKLPENLQACSVEETVEAFKTSLLNLNAQSVYAVLLHQPSDLWRSPAFTAVNVLHRLKELGLAHRVGLSVYEPEEIVRALDIFRPDIIQVPINVLDNRLIKSELLTLLASLGIEVHARSIFLQGLLLHDPEKLHPYFRPWSKLLSEWHHYHMSLGCTAAYAAFMAVACIPEINKVVVGFENTTQLLEILKPSDTFIDDIRFSAKTSDPLLLNPTHWQVS